MTDPELARAQAARLAVIDPPKPVDEQIDAILTRIFSEADTVGPHAREKLSGILKHYAKDPHPFRSCVTDNMQSGADRTEAAHTRYLPVGKVLVTSPYSIEGERIADTLNGQVDVSVAYNEAEPTMGPANEVILNHLDKNRYLREAAARLVRVFHPECFLCATVR